MINYFSIKIKTLSFLGDLNKNLPRHPYFKIIENYYIPAYALFLSTIHLGGYLWADYVVMYRQAIGEAPTTNWHSPILVMLIQVITMKWPDPFIPYVFQTLLVSIVFGMVLKRLRLLTSKIVFGLLTVSPLLAIPLGSILKDSVIILSSVYLYKLLENENNINSVSGMLRIVIIVNILIITRPILVVLFFLLAYLIYKSNIKYKFYFIASSILIIASSNFVPVTQKLSPEEFGRIWDIAYLSIQADRNLFEIIDKQKNRCDLIQLEKNFNLNSVDSLVFSADPCIEVLLPEEYKDFGLPLKAKKISFFDWISIIKEYPAEFIEFRVMTTLKILGISNEVYAPYISQIKDSPSGEINYAKGSGVSYSSNQMYNDRVNRLYNETMLGKIYWYPYPFILIFSLLQIFFWKRNKSINLLISLNIFIVFLYGVIGPGVNLRYTHVLNILISLYVIFLYDTKKRGRSDFSKQSNA
jgi:hypothetical protein